MAKKRRSRAFKETNQVINFDEEREKRREKRKQLTDKKKGTPAEPALVSGRRASKKMKRRLIFGAVVVVILCMVCYSAYNIMTLRAARAEAIAANAALQKEKSKLEKELSLVDSDEYIEEVARDELHMIQEGEKIYILPDETLSATAAAVSGDAVESTPGSMDIQPEEAPPDGTEQTLLDKMKESLNQVGENLKSLLRK